MKNLLRIVTLFSSLVVVAPSFAGLSLGATRVIFNSDQKEQSVNVINSDDSIVYLIRSWVSETAGEKKPPFVITPPLFRIDPGQTNALRISIKSNTLPQDKESLFWLNALAIPPTSEKGNMLQFSINSKIKLIYRPKSLDNEDIVKHAFEKLTFRKDGASIKISNPTPYYISLSKMTVNNVAVKDAVMVPPLGDFELKNAPSGEKITWQAINDYGGASEPKSVNLQ